MRAVQRGEAFAELDNGFVQVAAVDHARVRVTDTGMLLYMST
jgi:hypothetical protein